MRSPLLLNTVVDILANTTRHEKESKGIQTEKEEVKLSSFCRHHDSTYINPREYTHTHTHNQKTLLELMNEFSKGAGHKINI